MILVFPLTVVKENQNKAVSTPWEMWKNKLGKRGFCHSLLPQFPLVGSGYMSVALWLTIPRYLRVSPTHTPFKFWKLEARGTLVLPLWILRNLALKVASVLLQVLPRDVIRGVNGSLKQRHFPGAGFCHPVSVLSRGHIYHGYGRLWLALQQTAIIAPSKSRRPRARWLRGESNSLSRFCNFSLCPSLRTELTKVVRWVGMLVREGKGKSEKASQPLWLFHLWERASGNEW